VKVARTVLRGEVSRKARLLPAVLQFRVGLRRLIGGHSCRQSACGASAKEESGVLREARPPGFLCSHWNRLDEASFAILCYISQTLTAGPCFGRNITSFERFPHRLSPTRVSGSVVPPGCCSEFDSKTLGQPICEIG